MTCKFVRTVKEENHRLSSVNCLKATVEDVGNSSLIHSKQFLL